MPSLNQKTFEESRAAFVRLIDIERPQGSLNNEVIVVFDGQPGVYGRIESSTVKTVFSQYGSADDLIKKLVGQSANKKQIIVVTDDRELLLYVRAMGASIMPVREFIRLLKPSAAGSKRTQKASSIKVDSKKISYTAEHQITQEMEKIWLNKDKKQNKK